MDDWARWFFYIWLAGFVMLLLAREATLAFGWGSKDKKPKKTRGRILYEKERTTDPQALTELDRELVAWHRRGAEFARKSGEQFIPVPPRAKTLPSLTPTSGILAKYICSYCGSDVAHGVPCGGCRATKSEKK